MDEAVAPTKDVILSNKPPCDALNILPAALMSFPAVPDGLVVLGTGIFTGIELHGTATLRPLLNTDQVSGMTAFISSQVINVVYVEDFARD